MLAAAFMPAAVQLATADDAHLRELLAALVASAHARRAAAIWERHSLDAYGDRLASAWDEVAATAHFARPSTTLGLSRRGRHVMPQRSFRLSARHVPQLLWEHDYVHLRLLLPGVRERLGRRFCAIALVRLLESCTWREAIEALDLAGHWGQNMGGRAMTVLRAAGTEHDLFDGLRHVASRRQHQPLIDFRRRRAALLGWQGPTPEEWRRATLDHSFDERGARLVGVLAWAAVTGGDRVHAPAWRAGDARRIGRRQDLVAVAAAVSDHLAARFSDAVELH